MRTDIYINQKSIPENILFMPGLYNDAMELLQESQKYFTEYGPRDRAKLPANVLLLYSCEMSRITLRLSSVMSWLLMQRAIAAGEEGADYDSMYGLDFNESCLIDNRAVHGVLPPYVCHLLDSSLELYERVLRLAEQGQQQKKVVVNIH
ncbi:MAG: DUF1465 family protein [Rickettsiales bacterium]